ncbi:MAG TPA: ABC transporter substrate-binding protein [Pseudonocardiaceae bacterium]|nr:ABC transporter substrate-binding protein [Pseudonocardiaceae bacterium]
MYTRRKFFGLSAGSVAVLGLGSVSLAGLAGCDTGASGSAGGGTPQRGGTITFGTTGEPDSWDLHVAASSIAAVALRAVYDSLVNEKPDGTFEPWLAKSWTVSPDGLRYTFTLRQDVTFSDGTKFNSQAVKANFDHIAAPATASRNAATLIGPYLRTETPDPYTAVVVFSAPYSPFLGAASTPFLGFHSPAVLSANPAGIASGGRNVVSTGPFTFASVQAGQQAVFNRRPGYAWAPRSAPNLGESYLDGYTVRFLPTDAARVGALTSGQLDVADQVPATSVAQLRSSPSTTLDSRDNVGAPFTYALNVTKAPFDDPNVRVAIQSAVDTDSITKGLFQGVYERAWSVLTPSTPGYATSVEHTWGYDPAKAKKLLDAAGYTGTDSQGYRTKGGQRLSVGLIYASSFTTAEQLNYHTALKDALKQAGVELVLRPLDTAAVVQAFSTGDYHFGAYSLSTPDGSLLRETFYSKDLPSAGGSNVSRVADPQLDGWLDQALATQDVTARDTLYGKVQQRVLAQAFALPTYVGKRIFGVQSRVHGFALDVQNLPHFERVWVS